MSRCLGGFILDKFCVSFFKGRDTWGRGLVLWVKSYGMKRWKFATGQRDFPSNLDPSLPLLPFSLIITSCFPVTSGVGSEEASVEHCLCTTRPPWPAAAFHSSCALKSHHCHPLLGNFLPLCSSPFKLLSTTLQSHNTFSFFKSQHFFLKF